MQDSHDLHRRALPKAVIDGLRFAPCAHQAIFPQAREVLRERRLRDPHTLLQGRDARFTVHQVAKDHQPVPVGEGFQKRFRRPGLICEVSHIHGC